MAKANAQIKDIVKKLSSHLKESLKPVALSPTAKFAASVIVKRTRLGYGVEKMYGSKEKFEKLSDKYIKYRKMFIGLGDGTTTYKRSNLTFTGQMLRSIEGSVLNNGKILIQPTGTRADGKSNLDIANYAHKGSEVRPRRIFMNLSNLEFKQIVRFYRKTFGDLLRKRKVL